MLIEGGFIKPKTVLTINNITNEVLCVWREMSQLFEVETPFSVIAIP